MYVNLSVLTGFANEDRDISVLLGAFAPRIHDAAAIARVNRVLLLRSQAGVGLDVALAGLPFEARLIDRASPFTYPPDITLRTCSAEDLIVLKAFADRPKDWMDIEGVLVRHADTLDWRYVLEQLAPLAELKEAPELPGAARTGAAPRGELTGRRPQQRRRTPGEQRRL